MRKRMSVAMDDNSKTGHLTGFRTAGYRGYVLGILTLVYTLNFVDRILISVVSRPIIEEFGLSNFQFGLLTGIAFALLYTILGIPIASISERVNRVKIISGCVILWSLATVLCGFTAGFVSLLFARMLVGIGEAGCTPPANSIISDYFKPASRSAALGIYSMGVVSGGLLAWLFGGSLLQIMTWREAFIAIGAPGVIVGVLLYLTVKEPPRGYSDPPNAPVAEKPSFLEVLAEIGRKRTFWFVTIGAALAAFSGYALVNYQSLHVQYMHGLGPAETAVRYMAPISFFGVLGTFLGGYLTQLASKRFATAATWVPGIGLILSVPLYILSFTADNVNVMLVFMSVAALLHNSYMGAQYYLSGAVASARSRATTIAILLLIVNLVGYGLGPPIIGGLADIFTGEQLTTLGLDNVLSLDCNPRSLEGDLLAGCMAAKTFGIKWASVCASSLLAFAGIGFLLSGKTFLKDSVITDKINV